MYSRYKGGRCCLVYRQLVEDNLKAIGVVAGKSQRAAPSPCAVRVQFRPSSGCPRKSAKNMLLTHTTGLTQRAGIVSYTYSYMCIEIYNRYAA